MYHRYARRLLHDIVYTVVMPWQDNVQDFLFHWCQQLVYHQCELLVAQHIHVNRGNNMHVLMNEHCSYSASLALLP